MTPYQPQYRGLAQNGPEPDTVIITAPRDYGIFETLAIAAPAAVSFSLGTRLGDGAGVFFSVMALHRLAIGLRLI